VSARGKPGSTRKSPISSCATVRAEGSPRKAASRAPCRSSASAYAHSIDGSSCSRPTHCKNPNRLVFPLRGGDRGDKKSYGSADLRRAAGIERHVRWHDLRHTFASSLVAGWWGRAWRLDEVRDLLGHSSVTVTERYAHLAPSALAKAAADTDAAMVRGHAKVTPLQRLSRNRAESLGAPQRIRTSDLRLRRPSLYPAELVARETRS
jgi:integrase